MTIPPSFAAIRSALKQENLNPEIEEKLLQFQRFQEKLKQDSGPTPPPPPAPVSRPVAKKRPTPAQTQVVNALQDHWEATPKRKVTKVVYHDPK